MKRCYLSLVAGLAGLLLAPAAAQAFCGFYVAGAGAKLFNNATQVVLMREGTRTVLSMQNNYQGPASDFAMVVPVPVILQKDNVKTLPRTVFERVDTLGSPRLVEYWEQDPCYQPRYDGRRMRSGAAKDSMEAVPSAPMARDYQVKIEAQFVVGEYDIVILSAENSVGLYAWLEDNGYKIPQGAEPVLRPYVASGMKFFVAKVDIEKVQYDPQGRTMLSPLRFHYDSEVFSLPVRLGLLNSQGTQDLIVNVLARNQRYEVANYKNVTIPTNLRVNKRTLTDFGRFYASLFDETLRRTPGAVVTEYAWQAMSCDPCPDGFQGGGGALQAQEIMALGGDIMGSGANPWDFVLTRMHTRYGKDTLGEDLVFRAASPIVGGREVYSSSNRLEQRAQPSSFNSFQARYIVRHRWTGPVTCQNPVFGRWGGPPEQVLARGGNPGQPAVARDLALLKKRKVALNRYVLQSVPEIGLKVGTAKPKATTPAPGK